MQIWKYFIVANLVSIAGIVFVQAQEHDHSGDKHRQHGVHVHGRAQLNIVLEGQELLVELKSPGMNILGFEHAPLTDEQRAVVNQAKQILGDPSNVIELEGGSCRLVSAEVDMPAAHEHHGHGGHHGHAHDSEAMHSEIHTGFLFSCSDPRTFNSVNLRLFENYPGFEEIVVQWIINANQGSRTITGSNPILMFR